MMDLENITGPLAETYEMVDSSSIRSAAQLTAERLENKDLRNKWFWTSDANTSVVDGDDVVYHLTQAPEDNPIFADIDEMTSQLIRENNYFVSGADLEAVVSADSVLSANASELDLIEHSAEFSYFEIVTGDFDGGYGLNDVQRSFAERSYGEDEAFGKTMKMLSDAGISKTRVYVPNPKYVKSKLEDKEDSGFVRACRLDSFNDNSDFNAGDGYVDDYFVALRGVLKIAEGDVRKLEALKELNLIVDTPLYNI